MVCRVLGSTKAKVVMVKVELDFPVGADFLVDTNKSLIKSNGLPS